MDAKAFSNVLAVLLAGVAGLYWLFSLEAKASLQEAKLTDVSTHLLAMDERYKEIDKKLNVVIEDLSFIKGVLKERDDD